MNILELLRRPLVHVGDIEASTPAAFANTIAKHLRVGTRELTIVIDSDGGDLQATTAMYSLIQSLQRAQLNIGMLVVGHCYSAAMTLYMAVPRKHRYATNLAHFMLHPVTIHYPDSVHPKRLKGQPPRQASHDDATKEHYALQERWIVDCLSQGAGLKPEQVRRLLGARDVYFSADKARTLGFVGRVL